MVSPSIPAAFGELYSGAMADAAERLRLAEQYIRLGHVAGGASQRASANLSSLLLSQVCRIVADCTAPDFGVGGIVYDPHDPDDEEHCPVLFGPQVRKIMPVDSQHDAAGPVRFEPAPQRQLAPVEIHDIYDRLYGVIANPSNSGEDGSDYAEVLDFALSAHGRLFGLLNQHIVLLPEWCGVALVRFREERAEQADWLFLQDEPA